MIYLDYAASSPPYAAVCDTVSRLMRECCANPSSVHSAAAPARRVLAEGRRTMASLLGVPDGGVIFTSGGTESNNMALRCGAALTGRRQLIVSAQEHSSVLRTALAMKKDGYRVSPVYPDECGRIQPRDVAALASDDTALISVQSANNETGVLQDIEAIADVARRVGALYHCDAVQSFGHAAMPLSCADIVTLSAHKFGGPRGVGCVALRGGLALPPLLFGGGQELGLRSGTENVPGIAGMALAARLACAEMERESVRLRGLIDRLIGTVRESFPALCISSGDAERLPGLVSLRFPGMNAKELLLRLDSRGICVSAGSACAAGDRSPSPVLTAMGLSPTEARETLRLSIGHLTTEDEILAAANAIRELVSGETGKLNLYQEFRAMY